MPQGTKKLNLFNYKMIVVFMSIILFAITLIMTTPSYATTDAAVVNDPSQHPACDKNIFDKLQGLSEDVQNRAKIRRNAVFDVRGSSFLNFSCVDGHIDVMFQDAKKIWGNLKGFVVDAAMNRLMDELSNRTGGLSDFAMNGGLSCENVSNYLNRQLEQCFSFRMTTATSRSEFRGLNQCLVRANADLNISRNGFDLQSNWNPEVTVGIWNGVAGLLGIGDGDSPVEALYDDCDNCDSNNQESGPIMDFVGCGNLDPAVTNALRGDEMEVTQFDQCGIPIPPPGIRLAVNSDINGIEHLGVTVGKDYVLFGNFRNSAERGGYEIRASCYGYEPITNVQCGYEIPTYVEGGEQTDDCYMYNTASGETNTLLNTLYTETVPHPIPQGHIPKRFCAEEVQVLSCCDLSVNDCTESGLPPCPCTEGNLGTFENGRCTFGVVSCCNPNENDCNAPEYFGFPICDVDIAEGQICIPDGNALFATDYSEQSSEDMNPAPSDRFSALDYLIIKPDAVVENNEGEMEECCTTPWCNVCPQHVYAAYTLKQGGTHYINPLSIEGGNVKACTEGLCADGEICSRGDCYIEKESSDCSYYDANGNEQEGCQQPTDGSSVSCLVSVYTPNEDPQCRLVGGTGTDTSAGDAGNAVAGLYSDKDPKNLNDIPKTDRAGKGITESSSTHYVHHGRLDPGQWPREWGNVDQDYIYEPFHEYLSTNVTQISMEGEYEDIKRRNAIVPADLGVENNERSDTTGTPDEGLITLNSRETINGRFMFYKWGNPFFRHRAIGFDSNQPRPPEHCIYFGKSTKSTSMTPEKWDVNQGGSNGYPTDGSGLYYVPLIKTFKKKNDDGTTFIPMHWRGIIFAQNGAVFNKGNYWPNSAISVPKLEETADSSHIFRKYPMIALTQFGFPMGQTEIADNEDKTKLLDDDDFSRLYATYAYNEELLREGMPIDKEIYYVDEEGAIQTKRYTLCSDLQQCPMDLSYFDGEQ